MNYLNEIPVFLASESRYLQEVRLCREDQRVLEAPRAPTTQTRVPRHNTPPVTTATNHILHDQQPVLGSN